MNAFGPEGGKDGADNGPVNGMNLDRCGELAAQMFDHRVVVIRGFVEQPVKKMLNPVLEGGEKKGDDESGKNGDLERRKAGEVCEEFSEHKDENDEKPCEKTCGKRVDHGLPKYDFRIQKSESHYRVCKEESEEKSTNMAGRIHFYAEVRYEVGTAKERSNGKGQKYIPDPLLGDSGEFFVVFQASMKQNETTDEYRIKKDYEQRIQYASLGVISPEEMLVYRFQEERSPVQQHKQKCERINEDKRAKPPRDSQKADSKVIKECREKKDAVITQSCPLQRPLWVGTEIHH